MNSLRFFLPVVLAVFSSPLRAQVSVARTEISNAAQPQLTVGSDGRIWLVYGESTVPPTAASASQHKSEHGDGQQSGHGNGKPTKGHGGGARAGDVFVACSKDGGATFGPAIKVAYVPGLMLGNRRGPRIAVHGDRVTVTAIGHELVAFTSTDGGKTWSEPAIINDAPTSAREGLHDLASARDGKLFATWLDLRNGKTELWGTTSKDGGRTWAKNEQVYKSPDKSICECCHPTALFDDDGNLAVMWRNSIGGFRDMWMAIRPSGATRFAPAHKVGEGSWKLNACPMDGGRIVAFGGGKFGAVWQRNGEVFLTPPDGSRDVLLGKGKQPLAVTGGGATTVIWQQGNDLVFSRSGESEPTKLAANARFAVVVPASGRAIVAYEQGPTNPPGIVVERM